MSENEKLTLPWWIWIVVFLLLQISSEFSIFFLYTPGTADVYLPFSIAVILIYWFGPRVLIVVYLNTFINSYFWGHENILTWPIFGLPETLFVFLSWFLFIKLGKGKYGLPNLNEVIKYLLLGITIPLTIQIYLIKKVLIYYGELEASAIWKSFITSWIGDFMPTIVITLPVLFYLSRHFNRWIKTNVTYTEELKERRHKYFYPEMAAFFMLIIFLSVTMDFSKYWYVFGLISLFVAVRHGFGPTTLINLFILVAAYIIPASIFNQTSNLYFNQNELIETYLGINLLSLFSIICARVISDFRQAQYNIQLEISKVEKINQELDSFVYSVSHDLIAPLKSIKGLTHLIRLDENPKNSEEYVAKIEESANRLDLFIQEILDFSRNSRLSVANATINLKQMAEEIISNHRYIDGFERTCFDLSGIQINSISADEMRLKVILNNLISNAIKFSVGRSEPKIVVASKKNDQLLEISVEDNGHGISTEYLENIFNMFFRASDKSGGSGLGLYIAKEAAAKMNAKITVESKVGAGSIFTLSILQ